MKNLFSNRLSAFLTVLFLTLLAPAFTGSSDAAADSCLGGTASGLQTDGATASGITAGNLCSTALQTACEADTSCYWATTSAANTDDNALVNTLCNVLQLVTGNGGKAFAAFAIISLGIGFFTGKVSWGLMVGVAAGIAAMFGAPTIVAAISGEDTFDCTN